MTPYKIVNIISKIVIKQFNVSKVSYFIYLLLNKNINISIWY